MVKIRFDVKIGSFEISESTKKEHKRICGFLGSTLKVEIWFEDAESYGVDKQLIFFIDKYDLERLKKVINEAKIEE